MKRALLVILIVLVADQALKVWVKTHFFIGEYIPLFGEKSSWAYLQFVENRGMAFGLEFGGESGKLMLTLFRIAAVAVIGWLLHRTIRAAQAPWAATSLALILAGALGNIIDSAFYGIIFSASDPVTRNVAELFPADGGYAPFLHGAVVDMFYFPIWQGRLPDWLPIWGGEPFEFFRPVFNIADAAISIGVALMILTQRSRPAQPVSAAEEVHVRSGLHSPHSEDTSAAPDAASGAGAHRVQED